MTYENVKNSRFFSPTCRLSEFLKDLSKLKVLTGCYFFFLLFQSLGCDRPVNYKTEKLDAVLKKEFPVSAYLFLLKIRLIDVW